MFHRKIWSEIFNRDPDITFRRVQNFQQLSFSQFFSTFNQKFLRNYMFEFIHQKLNRQFDFARELSIQKTFYKSFKRKTDSLGKLNFF